MDPIYFLLLITLLTPFAVLFFTKRDIRQHFAPTLAFVTGGTFILWCIIWAFNNHSTRDTETLNGFVTTKEIHKFTCPINTMNPCENGYSCHCITVSYSCGTAKAPQTCYRQECDTCYVYPWEQNFYIDSSLQGERAYKISRVDKQGAITPPRWAAAKHGDPVSITSTYTNYILAAADSLFAEDGQAEEKYKDNIPKYPQTIYDYYRMNRLVTVGNVKVDHAAWNERISRLLVQVGPRKQANVVVVIAEGVGMDFANAVRRAWRGFKKNDIVVFAGVDTNGNLVWTRTMSWSKLSMVNVKMESDLLQQFLGKPLEPVAFTETIKQVSLAHFERRSMEEFEYLADEASLSSKQVYWLMFISVVLLIGSSVGQLYYLGILPLNRNRNSNIHWPTHAEIRHVFAGRTRMKPRSRFRP